MAKKISWQQRQSELKRAAIIEVLNAITSGEALESAADKISSHYNGKRLPNGKNLRLSSEHLKRLWYKWKKNPSETVFNLNYDGGPSTLIQPWISHLLTVYAIHYELSIPQAYDRLKEIDTGLPFVSRTMRRHISDTDQKRIRKAVQLRKEQAALDLEKGKLTGGKP